MKIAIVSSFRYHIECVGFLIASLGPDDAYDITVLTPYDKSYGYETYFKTLYEPYFNLKHIRDFKEAEYDLIIKLTANDPIKVPFNKTISLVHKATLSDRSVKKIVISSYVKLNPPAPVLMPVYQGAVEYHKDIKKEILWIGQLEDRWIDKDTLDFISSVKSHFTFIISTGCGRGNRLKNISNVTVINRISTEKLIEKILASDMILCRKFPHQRKDRYSGVLSLGMSHDKPMIMNKGLSDTYKIPGITFDKSYCELTDYVNNITVEQLNNHIEEIVQSREPIPAQNKEKLDEVIKSVVG